MQMVKELLLTRINTGRVRFLGRHCYRSFHIIGVMRRLDRDIQYVAAPRLNHCLPGALDRPGQAGDDSEGVATALSQMKVA
ncbi:hypothetical protein KUL72_27875 [Bradyrhizobium arachidis]|uniref:hypothetical protein n=1 Tax=Bradyrhizobium TaxID=374 RepID=UPI0021625F81|nr:MULTISPECIES: hypothetical protein [Bradyrhizobium]MDN4988619.1 hypothetical protein [Bradyrhizobium sp. WYCCWR 13022]UVO40719.1 hypothetical protein KUL72_27875 [Bradyrhizobium arachidis]